MIPLFLVPAIFMQEPDINGMTEYPKIICML